MNRLWNKIRFVLMGTLCTFFSALLQLCVNKCNMEITTQWEIKKWNSISSLDKLVDMCFIVNIQVTMLGELQYFSLSIPVLTWFLRPLFIWLSMPLYTNAKCILALHLDSWGSSFRYLSNWGSVGGWDMLGKL